MTKRVARYIFQNLKKVLLKRFILRAIYDILNSVEMFFRSPGGRTAAKIVSAAHLCGQAIQNKAAAGAVEVFHFIL